MAEQRDELLAVWMEIAMPAEVAIVHETRKIADERGLGVTPENLMTMMEEHSPSYVEYRTWMRRVTYVLEAGVDSQGRLQELRQADKRREERQQALRYLMQHLHDIRDWEPWTGDLDIDMDTCHEGLKVLEDEDLFGDMDEQLELLRGQLDAIRGHHDARQRQREL